MKKDPTGITGGPGMSETDAAICAFLTLACPTLKSLAEEAVELERALPKGMAKTMAQEVCDHVHYLTECAGSLIEALREIGPEERAR